MSGDRDTFAGAVDQAREHCHPGLDGPMGVSARDRAAADFLRQLAAGRGADAVAARLALEHAGDPRVVVGLDCELRDLAALARGTETESS